MSHIGAEPAIRENLEPDDARDDHRDSQPVTSGRVASSAMWRATETAGTELVAFLVFTTLARLLAPDDFGAVALAGSIMTMLQGLVYHGFTEALIQRPNVGDVHHRAVLAANLAVAVVLLAVGLAVAWPIGWMLGRAEFPLILSALLPSLLLRALSSPMLAALRRDMDFRAIALRTLLGVLVGGLMAIVLAKRGAGYWALVMQQWSVEIVGFVVLAGASPAKPWRLRWHQSSLRELLPVALPVMGAAFLSNAARRLDTFALGMFLPNRLVGIYFMVYRLVFAAQMVTQHGMSDVAMVVLSSMHQDTMLYRRGLLRALRLMLFVCACAFGLLSVAGPWLIPLVFGPQWAPATAPLQVLAAFSTGGAVVSIAGTILVASGYAQAFSRLAVGSAFGQLVAVALAARWGLVAVAWAAGLAQCIAIWPALRMLSQHYHLRVRTLCAEIAPIALLLGASMGLAVWLDRFAGPARWFMHPTASFGFCVLMAIGALALLRKEKERMSRPPDRY